MKNNISDKGIVLSRVNYAETDRILTVLLSSYGKLSVIAKGVRAGRSKLAGGIELFAENELVLLKGKSDLYIVTSSRMKTYFGNIAKDIEASSYVYECLKMINSIVPDGSGEEYYDPLLNLMDSLEKGAVPLRQTKIWFSLKLLDNLGSSPNLKTDNNNKNLSPEAKFQYDFDNHCFFEKPTGPYTSNHIKILRHLTRVSRPVEIKTDQDLSDEAERLVSLILKQHFN